MAFDPLANIRPKSGIAKIFNYEFLNPNLWEFYFDDNQEIRFMVQNTTLPFIKFETETRNMGSKVLKSVTPEDTFSITFNETSTFDVYEYMTKWMDAIFDKKERKFRVASPASNITAINGVAPQVGYVKTAVLSMFQYKKPNIFVPAYESPTKAWKFSNLMLVGIDTQTWDYEGTAAKQITCQFTVDSVDEMTYTSPTL